MEQNMGLRFQNRSAASRDGADGGIRNGQDEDAGSRLEEARSLRALHVLDHLAGPASAHAGPAGAAPGHAKTTLMRLLAAMQRAGFVAATPVERGYVPGPQAGALALATLRASAYTRLPSGAGAAGRHAGRDLQPDRAGRRASSTWNASKPPSRCG